MWASTFSLSTRWYDIFHIVPFWRYLMWIIPCSYQKAVAMTLLADRATLAFFEADSSGESICFDWCLVCCAESIFDSRLENCMKTPLECGWTTLLVITLLRLWLIMSKRGTYLADSFLILTWSFKAHYKYPFYQHRVLNLFNSFAFGELLWVPKTPNVTHAGATTTTCIELLLINQNEGTAPL